MAHSIVTYTNPRKSMVPFQGSNAPVPNALLAHLYGVKNFYTVLMRLYAAYNLHQSRETYHLAMWSYAGVFFLYSTETFVYQTVRPREAAIPFVYSLTGLIWMWTQRDFYLP